MSWRDDPAYLPGGVVTEPRPVEPVEEKPKDLYVMRRVPMALGVIKRAEKFCLWRSRAWGLKWLEALKAGTGREWWAENRDEFYAVLEADEWFEPMLTGEGLMAGLRMTFAGEEKNRGLVKK